MIEGFSTLTQTLNMFPFVSKNIDNQRRDRRRVLMILVVWLMIYALVIPLVILAAWSSARFPPHKAHVTLLGFAISMLLTLFVTDVCAIVTRVNQSTLT